MATSSEHRSVTLQRTALGAYSAVNRRGGQISVGSGGTADFTPVELLLAAIGGCTAVDVDLVTSRRAEPESFTVEIGGDKVRDEQGNHLAGLEVTFRVAFPAGEQGDAARSVLPGVVALSHDRLCTVSRTVELGTPITTHIA
jgi:putative redox protein